MSLWPPDRVLMLRNLSALGFEPGQIAERMGNVSRASVINKLHDLGLPCRFPRQEDRREKCRPQRVSTPAPISLPPIP